MKRTAVDREPALGRLRVMRLRLAQLVGIAAALKVTFDVFGAQAQGGASLAGLAKQALVTGVLFGIVGVILGVFMAAVMRWRQRS